LKALRASPLRSALLAIRIQRRGMVIADMDAWLLRRCTSWSEHGGVAILSVGIMNSLLVVTGLVITWLSMLKRYELDCRAQRLKSDLARTERQLEQLFGPLRASTHATGVGWDSFIEEHRATPSLLKLEERISRWPKGLESKRYQMLVRSTLQPLNRRAMETVLTNTHLIDGEFPECLYHLYSHVIEMDSLLERWRHGDFAVMFAPRSYPRDVKTWANQEFERLRRKQNCLLLELGEEPSSAAALEEPALPLSGERS